MIDSFSEAPNGLVLIADGLNRPSRWDVLTSAVEPAGMILPTVAPALGGSGVGAIVGTYYGYLRFLDRFGQVSDLSPISGSLSASASTGTVESATNAAPIVVTSTAHGLTTGKTVFISGGAGNTGVNGTFVVTVLTADTFSLNSSAGTGAYIGGATWSAGILTITYTSVQIPTEAKVTRRQLLRNTNGQAQVFYVDVDTTDISGSTFTSTKIDSALQSQTAVPLFDDNGRVLANAHGIPPSHKSVLAHHLDRMFLAAEVTYATGSVSVTNSSTSVQGIGTSWPSTFAGRALWVVGATARYEIASVNTTTQVIALTSAYQGSTDPFADYAIRAQPGERRLLYYSEASQPESWPAINALSLQEDGDEITGLMPKGSFLYILERRHIYRFTFQSDPSQDGYVFLSANRGCVNNRCWVLADDAAYCLDEQGVHAFSGGADVESVSVVIQDLFQKGINWQAKDLFHAVHDPGLNLVRWYVCLTGTYVPRHALCYDYRLKRWWLEEHAFAIGASCNGTMNQRPAILLAGGPGHAYQASAQALDGANAGTLRGQVTSSTPTSLSDARAQFAATGLLGAPVAIVSGRGKGQSPRIITKVTGTRLSLDRPWAIQPDATSMYQLGGIQWKYRSGWFRFSEGDDELTRRVELAFTPTHGPASLDLELYLDRSESALVWGSDLSSADAGGLASVAGDTALVGDLTKSTGFLQRRLDGHRELYVDGPRFVQVGLSGVGHQEDVVIHHVILDGVVAKGDG